MICHQDGGAFGGQAFPVTHVEAQDKENHKADKNREKNKTQRPDHGLIAEVVDKVKKEGGGKGKAVDPVHDAAMTRQERACVLDPHVPLQG